MKKSKHDPVVNIDEFEDLTLFANESFDTQDVDLFEFTSEESSPLTRLKSIILSLDWEINDEILQELADELSNLESMWHGDKVAEVYLQGLSKIGSYIRSKGAYAHPNSIKLLLTFFYNFEKIISSQNITGDDITNLLKGDVRKFKILQYQINQSEQIETAEIDEEPEPFETAPHEQPHGAIEESDTVKQLRAAILSLDWEVTNDSLNQFNRSLQNYQQDVSTNKPAMILVQGLQALGDYIAEERAEAHPEAFTLLHSYSEALEDVTHAVEKGLDQQQIEELLVDRVNRLNQLKMLIAAPSGAAVDDPLIDEVVDQISAPIEEEEVLESPAFTFSEDLVEEEPLVAGIAEPSTASVFEKETDDALTDDLGAEIDTLFAFGSKPAMETADSQYPDEILPPDAIKPVDDELADDFIEAHLSSKRGIMPALSDAEELSGFNEDTEPIDLPAQHDLAEQLDFLFAESEEEEEESLEPLTEGLHAHPAETPSIEEPVVGALADAIPPEDSEEDGPAADGDSQEIQNKLNSFFDGFSSDEPQTEETIQQDGIKAALADSSEEQGFSEQETDSSDSELDVKLDAFFLDDEQEAVEEELQLEEEIELIEDDGVTAALADSAEEQGYSEQETDSSDSELDDKLDAFFLDDEQEAVEEELQLEEEIELIEDDGVTAALADSTEEQGYSEQETDASDSELDVKLDAFFLDDEQEAVEEELQLEEELELIEDDGVTAALADSSEEQGYSEQETGSSDSELDDKLDAFFLNGEQGTAEEDIQLEEDIELVEEDATMATLADSPVEQGIEEDIQLEEDIELAEEDAIMAVLADSPEQFEANEEVPETTQSEVDDELALSFDSEEELALEDNLDNFFQEEEFSQEILEEKADDELTLADELEEQLFVTDEQEENVEVTADSEETLFDDQQALAFAQPEILSPAETSPDSEEAILADELEEALLQTDELSFEEASTEEESDDEEPIATLDFTPMDEIEDKLDFFFGDEADDVEQEEEAESSSMTEDMVEAVDMASALTESSPDEIQEEEAFLTLEEEMPEEAEDFFQDATDDDEEEPEAELTEALDSLLADETPKQEEVPPSLEDSLPLIAGLGALLPGLVRETTTAKVEETSQALTALQKAELSPTQQALVQLFDSSVQLFARLPNNNERATEKMINTLYEHLQNPAAGLEVLPEAIAQYSAWMVQSFTCMPTVPAQNTEDGQESPHYEYTAKELYFELAELKATLKQELDKVWHELHHHRN